MFFPNDIKSCIINHCHCSEFLTIGRSVRQDYPLSSVSDIQSLFFKFIWSDKPDKVKRNLLVQSYENGG